MEDVEVELHALAYGGACVGEIAEGPLAGKKAFVRSSVPGERALVRIVSEKNSFVEAELLQVLRASPQRIIPPCPHFGVCGGCDLQHMEVKAQRAAKRDMVESMLKRQAKLTPLQGVELIGENLPEYGYRRRVMLHLDTSGTFGFFKSKSGEVISIRACLISAPEINSFLASYGGFLSSIGKVVASVVVEVSKGDVSCGFHLREGQKAETLLPVLDTLSFPFVIWHMGKVVGERQNSYPVGQFSQVNEAANKLLIEKVIECCDEDEITDLYAGSGNFSLPLAQKGKKVTAVEVSAELVALGKKLADEQGLNSQLNFVEASCEQYLKRNKPSGAVILDPPRSGAKNIVTALDPKVTKRVIYVSCALPTLARDLVILKERGYTFQKTLVIDMFPQTHHVETVSVLLINN